MTGDILTDNFVQERNTDLHSIVGNSVPREPHSFSVLVIETAIVDDGLTEFAHVIRSGMSRLRQDLLFGGVEVELCVQSIVTQTLGMDAVRVATRVRSEESDLCRDVFAIFISMLRNNRTGDRTHVM